MTTVSCAGARGGGQEGAATLLYADALDLTLLGIPPRSRPAVAPTKRLHDLGIEATSMEMPGFSFLHRHRQGSHFVDIARDLQRAALEKKPTSPV